MESVAELPHQKPKIGRRSVINDDVVNALSILIGKKQLSEIEACAKIGLNYNTWTSWKNKRKNCPRFQSLISRVRAETIEAAVDRVEAAGAKDWRADAARLGWMDRDRFGVQRPEAPQVNVNVGVNVLPESRMLELLEMVRKQRKEIEKQPSSVDVSADVKQIDEAK